MQKCKAQCAPNTNLERKTRTKVERPKYIMASEILHSFAKQFNKGNYPSNFIYENELRNNQKG